jgi:hypothetical protein
MREMLGPGDDPVRCRHGCVVRGRLGGVTEPVLYEERDDLAIISIN